MNDIIIALDNMTRHAALDFAKEFSGKVWGYKINSLLIDCGVSIIPELKKFGGVFADPKLHDIPNTVNKSVEKIDRAGADLITVHLSGGMDMIAAAMNATTKSKIIGVTMLTSQTPNNIRQIYRGFPLERLGEIAVKSRIPGIVCSGQELPFWNIFDNMIKVVPGLRPNGAMFNDDQARHCDKIKTDFVVIGRPITEARDPMKALEDLKLKLAEPVADRSLRGQ